MESASKRLEALLAEDRAAFAEPAVLVSRSAAATIIDYAKRRHVDLIVVGTHGRGPVAHLFMGSGAEQVVRSAPCPVLVVRPNEHEFILPDPVAVHARI